MYITNVIEIAKKLHPSEYSALEYIRWCDELSAKIMRNYNESYSEKTETGSCVLLPPGIDIDDISKIIMDGKELVKTDLRDFGIDYRYSARGRELKKNDGTVSEFRIIYRTPHDPIRYIDTDAAFTFGDGYFMCGDIDVYSGDTLTITSGEDTYTVYVIDIIAEEDGAHYLYDGDTVPEGTRTVHVYREIQDMTLLPAPYDSAYIDFCNAKVSLYQNDSAAYNAFMSQYTSKMSDYERYITRNKARVKRKFMNWL